MFILIGRVLSKSDVRTYKDKDGQTRESVDLNIFHDDDFSPTRVSGSPDDFSDVNKGDEISIIVKNFFGFSEKTGKAFSLWQFVGDSSDRF